MTIDLPTKYEFPTEAMEERAYCAFPEGLEKDEQIYFHGTAEGSLKEILANGFTPEPPLTSVSFTRKSSVALGYACSRRSSASPNGCIIAVRYDRVDLPGIVSEAFGIHDYRRNVSWDFVGYCVVPASYQHK
jgi:hypothetical protein